MPAAREFPEWLWSVAFCALFLLVCGGAYLGVIHDWDTGPSEAELVDDGWPYCSDWAGSMGIDENAQCIDDAELVLYYDTSYGASLKYAHDYVDSID